MADLSPFVIEKCIQSIVGHPKTIKKLKSGDLLLEVDRQQQVENLLKTTKIFDLKVKISLHQSLNSSKGVIRCPELRPCSNKEIIDNLTDKGVTGVRNVSVRRNGVLKINKHIRFDIQYTDTAITKVAGVHVSCTDAQTQTDETCIAELKSATSNAGSKPTLAPPLSGMAQIKMGVVPSTSTQPNPAETKSSQNLLKQSLRRTQKTKSTQVELQRDQMIPLKFTTDMVPLTRTTWRLRLLLAVLVEASLLDYLQLDTYSSNLTTSLRQYNYYQ